MYLKLVKTDTVVSIIDIFLYIIYNLIMDRTIYHGSAFIINKPECHKGNPHNDYGYGFYCCSNKSLGKEWAARATGSGFLNIYKIRDDNLKILDLTKAPYDNVLYWIALLIHNRKLPSDLIDNCAREIKYLEDKYLIDVSKWDIVIGYRADDAYFRFPEAFVSSAITLESLERVFKAGDLGKQYVLVSKHAISLLRFVGYEEVKEEYRTAYYYRKNNADKVFSAILEKDRYSIGTRMIDFVRDYEQ